MFHTFDMPGNMAVQGPYPRVVRDEPYDDVRLGGHRDGIAAHGILQAPGRRVGAVGGIELAGTPAYNLETMAGLWEAGS